MPNPYVRQRQMEAYWRAVDSGTIITSLPLLTEGEAGAVPTPEAIERCKLTRSHKLHYLKSASPVTQITWMFRTFGSTEEENPDHRMAVIESFRDHGREPSIRTFSQTAGIIPTVEEYVDIIFDLVEKQNGRIVYTITVDTESLVEPLQAVLAEVPVRVFLHAKISKEDEFLNDLTDPDQNSLTRRLAKLDLKLCALCTAPHTDEGNPLLRCSSCKRACYCCKEHQKIDWPNHRDLCKHAKLQE